MNVISAGRLAVGNLRKSIFTLLLGTLTATASAQDCECVPSSTGCSELSPDGVFGGESDSLWDRDRLTGDWGGYRTDLQDSGVNLYGSSTHFYQGVASGGREREFEYGGKLDYRMDVEGGKLGLNPGLFVNVHAETRYGNSINNIDGALAPGNIAMAFPLPDENVTALAGVMITQALSEEFAVFGGKINTLDQYPIRYNGGPGLAGFMNTSLVFNPIGGRTVPYSAAGVGFAIMQDKVPVFTFTVFDPDERSTIGFDDLFENGVLFVPDLVLRTNFWDRPGIVNIGGTYSSKSYTSVDPAAYLANIPGLLAGAFPQETGSWSVYSAFYQALWVDRADPQRNWGVFGQFGVSDGNPNPIQYVANGGIGGRSMLPGRSQDTFGVGVFYLGLSSEFKRLARPFVPQDDEYGFETFYNYAVTPWCHVTGDLQVVNPSTISVDTAVITGMRVQVLF
jgi:porin